MASTKHSKLKIKNIPKNYKYREWLDSVLQTSNPTLDYSSFARTFRGSKNATNNHYSDLLEKLKNNQSNKLMTIVKKAKNLYSLRNKEDCEFGQKYREYWEERDNIRYREIVQRQNRSTVIRLNRLTNYNIQQLAEKAYGTNEDDGENETLEEVSEEGGESGELERGEDTDIEDDTRVVLRQSSDLPSNE
ncbi:hypothetical protein G6F56_006342 [Rhizopus delemar]|nr:hypothetical protein G6F56_006342 [Rhizopus delemar]